MDLPVRAQAPPGGGCFTPPAPLRTGRACAPTGEGIRRLEHDLDVGQPDGLPTWYRAACSGSSTSLNSVIRLFSTANTASESMYALSDMKMCVVSGRYPSADTMKWMCAGRTVPPGGGQQFPDRAVGGIG